MDKYIFPAIFEPGEKKGYCVTFPDLPGCVTEGDSLEEALRMAREALELHLYGLEEDGDPIPSATPPDRINVPRGAFITFIETWMPLVRDEMANKAVKKTLTIPKWLNDLAEQQKVNFSRVLQRALKDYLGIHDYSGHPRKQP
ncbi:MAG: type II toxin-antitoxin system HicB family antitoxin [Firmicutes bacterium]|nr:type II toxin-antitoxin system HicB family antitoxin [Bacillota bacterium]